MSCEKQAGRIATAVSTTVNYTGIIAESSVAHLSVAASGVIRRHNAERMGAIVTKRTIPRRVSNTANGIALHVAAHAPKRVRPISEEQAIILAIIATMFSQIGPHETTKKLDKVRAQIRRYLKSWHHHEREDYDDTVREASVKWDAIAAKLKAAGHDKVSMAESFRMLTPMIEFKQMPFSEKSLSAAAQSLEQYAARDRYDMSEAAVNAQHMSDIVAEELGMNNRNGALAKLVRTKRAEVALREKEKEMM